MSSTAAGFCHDFFPRHAPAAQSGPDPYAYLPMVPSFQLAGDAGAHQYVGGAPPAGGVHEYYLTVTALSVAKTGLDQNASAAYLGFTIAGHTLARATLICPTPASAA